ncbi:WYL domain-containing transcriptional regulator [Clostridium estertheticum]|uniref:helix-turn-helix transcriptional regulator n=1 Tax=Clostridium estertheticum TaxID=238834 RepID=UPI001C0C8E42|nr:WYL domain-containing transcriptional regulator [Clostridium estertheticum]MBU3218184.1 WYL domain-containing transcriptional regulator [Clostridium estertheticum]WAG55873.1 WYL domain-containing transcriptional regulator [Clostridium estertheticum]
MSKFSNLLRLLILLKSKKRMKTKEIAYALGVSERMIRKYMSDLAEANVNVESVPGPTGGYELVGYDYLLNLDIKAEEAIALQMATVVLKKSTNFDFKQQLENLNDKIKILNESCNQLDDYSDNIIIKPKSSNLDKEIKFELEIQSACISKKKLLIKYCSVSSGETERIIHPYGIITRNNFKYLVAYCENRKIKLIFKLMRITQVASLNDCFDIPATFSIKEFMKNNLGLFHDENYNLKLLIKHPFSKAISEGLYAKNQKIKWVKSETIIFEGQMSGKTDIIRWILSMGTSVTVLEPMVLKKEIKENLKQMLEII